MNDANHDGKVRAVQTKLREFHSRGEKAKIYHGSSNSTRPFTSSGLRYVDVSNLDQILEINAGGLFALVEPNVPLDTLVRETLKYGFVPPIIAEFPGITVGGAVQGGSGESSSFKWGTFHDICEEYEIATGDGRILNASARKNADLYWGMSCAHGSLGVLTRLKIRLVPASKYVRLDYRRTKGRSDAVQTMLRLCGSKVDFVDGILFSRAQGVVISGTFTDEPGLPVARFGRVIDDWFYIHAQKVTRNQDTYTDLVPIQDYLFRYDRGGFWVAKYGFGPVPFNRLTRLLFAGLFKTRTLYKLLQGSNYAYRFFAQDICLPKKKVTEFLDFADTEYGIYPLWLCPLRPAKKDFLSCTAIDTDMVINVGIWGEAQTSELSFKARNRLMEQKVHELGGRKVLYAHAYYTEDEFWRIYNRTAYGRLRKKYGASKTFPDLYQKVVTPKPAFEPSRRRGLVALLKSPFTRK